MMQQNISIQLEKVRTHFLTELKKQYREVEMLRDQLDQVADPLQICRDIGRICHKIAGTAATLGFPDLGHVAAEIDDFVASFSATRSEAFFEMREHADHLLVLMSLLLDDESVFA
jgi:HPt (histidine-containing phosphotransfer) domain-containing protein